MNFLCFALQYTEIMLYYNRKNIVERLKKMETIYFDEIHKRGTDGLSVLYKLLLIVGCVLVCPVAMLLAGQFGAILVAAIIYGVYLLFRKMNKEFEYIYTNGEVDIDVIYGRATRRRMITLKPREIEIMAKVGGLYESYKNNRQIQKHLDFSDGNKNNSYFVVVNSNNLKKLILISPSERLLEHWKPYLRERFQ